ncbi:MAG: TolB family protein [Actinomycetota bacterium]
MPDTHEDIRNRLFDAAWETPAYAPEPERTVSRARRRAAGTIGGGILAAALTIVVVVSSLPVDTLDRTALPDRTEDDREFLVDIPSGRVTEITAIRALKDAWWLNVSPDGEQVAFTTDTTGSPQVYVANLDGSDVRQLTRGLPDVAETLWSPSGQEIAYIGLSPNGTRNLYVVDVATERSRKVTHESRDTWSPEWSPDGRSILYNVTVKGAPIDEPSGDFAVARISAQLRIADVATGESEIVFGGSKALALDGTWTLDGIVFVRSRELGVTGAGRGVMGLGPYSLQTIAVPAGRPHRLLEIPEFAWTPEASPDGTMIAYARQVGGDEQIFLFDLATGRNRTLRPGFAVTWVDERTVLIQDRPA